MSVTATTDRSGENQPAIEVRTSFARMMAENRRFPSLEEFRALLLVDRDVAAGRCPTNLAQSMGDLAYSCRVGNADSEPDPEVAVAIFGRDPGSGLAHLFLVLKPGAAAAEVVFEQLIPRSWLIDTVYRNFLKKSYQPLIAVGYLNGNGFGELVYAIGSCGMNTCYHDVRIAEGRPEGYVDLSGGKPPSSAEDSRGRIFMSNSRIEVKDVEGDGFLEIVVTGGTVGSAGAGLQRKRTDTFGWDGSQYVRRSSTWEETEYLYHQIVDAEQLIDGGDYDRALAKYLEISTDSGLVADYKPNEEPGMRAWVDYRIALLMLRVGLEDAEVRSYLDSAISSHGEGMHSRLAGTFRQALDEGSGLREACQAVDKYVAEHLRDLAGLWNYGWLNPSFDPASVCPPWVWQEDRRQH